MFLYLMIAFVTLSTARSEFIKRKIPPSECPSFRGANKDFCGWLKHFEDSLKTVEEILKLRESHIKKMDRLREVVLKEGVKKESTEMESTKSSPMMRLEEHPRTKFTLRMGNLDDESEAEFSGYFDVKRQKDGVDIWMTSNELNPLLKLRRLAQEIKEVKDLFESLVDANKSQKHNDSPEENGILMTNETDSTEVYNDSAEENGILMTNETDSTEGVWSEWSDWHCYRTHVGRTRTCSNRCVGKSRQIGDVSLMPGCGVAPNTNKLKQKKRKQEKEDK